MKRAIDVAAAAVGLMALSPLMAATALLVKLTSPGPVFYRGLRCGLEGNTFEMLKFRTMRVDAEKVGGPSTSGDDPRVTAAGRLLRRFKLDELPQLINVLRGDMSLVGPRPEVPQEVERYTDEWRQVLTVRPGITDYASIRFRNEGEILRGEADPHEAYRRLIQPEKMRLALEYVRTRSVWVDLKIIFMTFRAVVAG